MREITPIEELTTLIAENMAISQENALALMEKFLRITSNLKELIDLSVFRTLISPQRVEGQIEEKELINIFGELEKYRQINNRLNTMKRSLTEIYAFIENNERDEYERKAEELEEHLDQIILRLDEKYNGKDFVEHHLGALRTLR